jgi:outer membrane murein-binding lipoprotein Lpp
MPMRRDVTLMLTVVAVGILVAAGCGSSKPEYCSKVSDLQNALNTLKGNVTNADFSALNSDVQTVKTDVDAVASSAKSDFPSETRAVQSSVSTLTSTVQSFPSSPSAKDLARLTGAVGAAITSVSDFRSATSSACD